MDWGCSGRTIHPLQKSVKALASSRRAPRSSLLAPNGGGVCPGCPGIFCGPVGQLDQSPSLSTAPPPRPPTAPPDGWNSPLLSPPAAAASRASRAPSPRVGRRARRVDGQDWCCCAPSARHTRWRWPCPPWPRASCTPPPSSSAHHPPPPHPTPQSQGADGRHQAQADPAHGGGSVPGDPGATSVALVVWLNRRPSCFATFCTPIYRLLQWMNTPLVVARHRWTDLR